MVIGVFCFFKNVSKSFLTSVTLHINQQPPYRWVRLVGRRTMSAASTIAIGINNCWMDIFYRGTRKKNLLCHRQIQCHGMWNGINNGWMEVDFRHPRH